MPESSWNRVIYWKLSSGFRVAFGWWLLSASVADTVLGLNSLLRCQLSPVSEIAVSCPDQKPVSERSDDDLQRRRPFLRRPLRPIDQNVNYTNFLIRIVSTLKGNLNFLGFALNYGFNDFLHDARQIASCVMMHAVGPLQMTLFCFRRLR
jgi:hypothetical protein